MVDRLGRHPLSVILSHLTEADGTSFLLTRKRYAAQLLPIFRLPPSDDDDDDDAVRWDELVVVNDRGERIRPTIPVHKKKKNRHKFVAVPVQDPTVLLARLNTRRLHRRREPVRPSGNSTAELARSEWNEQRTQQQHPYSFRPCHLQLLRFHDASLSPMSPSRESASDLLRAAGLTLLVSYPRSGNSLARSLLEQCTGLVTGSDTRPDYDLSKELAVRHGMVGEGVTSGRLAFAVKSHWPERAGACPVAGARRAVVIARNPYDAADSYWNMCATKSHTLTVANEVYERFRDKYRDLVRNEIGVWLRFHHYWLSASEGEAEAAAAARVPVLLVRYEDLVRHPECELARMMRFVLQVDRLDEYWTARVRHVVVGRPAEAADNPQVEAPPTIDNLGSYRPRTGAASAGECAGAPRLGKALRRDPRHMTDDLVQFIHQESERFERNYLKLLGYDALNDGFPDHLPPVDADWMTALRRRRDENLTSTQTVNEGCTVRPLSCPFGRGMRAWRHSVTDKDQNPLPTIDSGK